MKKPVHPTNHVIDWRAVLLNHVFKRIGIAIPF